MNLLDLDFSSFMSNEMLLFCDTEFQHQMDNDLSDWVVMPSTKFAGFNIQSPQCMQDLAVLQFFYECACPISQLRIGSTFSKRNFQGGPIRSDYIAVTALLAGLEHFVGALRNPRSPDALREFANSSEMHCHCTLAQSYIADMKEGRVCPEILRFIKSYMSESYSSSERH